MAKKIVQMKEYNGSSNDDLIPQNAQTADYPTGFSSMTTTDWGATAGSGDVVSGWDTSNGGIITFKNNYPATGELSMIIDGTIFVNEGNDEVAIKNDVAPLSGYDSTKGTIEQRLTSLGFKQGTIVNSSNSSVGWIKRTGNYVIGYINVSTAATGSYSETYTINPTSPALASDFYPSSEVTLVNNTTSASGNYYQNAKMSTSGVLTVNISSYPSATQEFTISLYFGYEITSS